MLLATYNVLAQAYLRPEWYRAVPSALLEPAARLAAVLERVAALEADVLCLQEVEQGTAEALAAHLGRRGYHGQYQRKGQGRPDGCATFWRGAVATGVRVLAYDEGLAEQPSGHLALAVGLRTEGGELEVVNTHLKWDDPTRPPEARWCVVQARALAAWLEGGSAPAVVCGDLNVGARDPAVAALLGAGFRDVFGGAEHPHTCVAHGRTARIDHILVRGGLEGSPGPAAALEGRVALPDDREPSDHVPLVARLEWSK
jgi:endonuclease/exonuclease/phosphatase family metal-dependent hydrolase